MVVIHIKRSDTEQFLFETTCATSNDELIRHLVQVWNARIRIAALAAACEELSKYGPAKPEDLRGLDDVRSLPLETPSISAINTRAPFTQYTSQDTPLLEGQGQGATAGAAAATAAGVAPGTTVKDPSGQRCGAAPDAKAAETLQACARDASAYISKRQVETKQALSVAGCKEVVDNCRGAVMIAYPMGLPEYDPITLLMDFDTDLSATAIGQGMLDAETATLWWAGKEFHRDQTVGDRVGRNEKTKIVARLQKQGGGAPAREPGISEAERKAMMAHYFKKQEEAKALAEADEDDYLNSSWANPRAMKESLHGIGGVSWKARR